MSFTWFPFPKDWPAWFRAKTGKPHNRASVNAQCAYIADLYRQYLGRGENQYGFYHGPMEHPYWQGRPLARHGWLLVTDEHGGSIIYDPTRWCFYKGNKPLLAIATADSPEYDHGMNRTKASLFAKQFSAIPDFNPDKEVKCDQPDICALFQHRVCVLRLAWLANLPTQHEVFKAPGIRVRMFRWLQDNGYKAFIPMDNRI